MKSVSKIQKLSPDVQSILRSGIYISDVTHCISELVQNSLDAEAKSVAVRINLENFTLQVVDNGHGLTKEDLDMIGQRYMTSKCHSIKDLKKNLSFYGFRGESLASIRESCAILMIMSRPEGSEQTYSKVFRAGKESHGAAISTHNRLCIGTTVVVKDFLHNFPVRRARIQPALEIEYIRQCLIHLSIINYKVSFTLRNDVTKLVILQTQEFSSAKDAFNFHCNLKENHNLITESSKDCRFQITVHISKETESTGSFQFIYVNGRLVRNKRIYELVNKHLSKSFSMRNIGKEVREKEDKPKEKAFPVFIIDIQCPFSEYDITSDPKKTKVEFKKWDYLEKSLQKIVEKFVTSENTLYGVSEQSCDLHQNKENNLDSLNNASHDDHVIKCNVLCSKSVTRPITNLKKSEYSCEKLTETNHNESSKNMDLVLSLENKESEKTVQLEQIDINLKVNPVEIEAGTEVSKIKHQKHAGNTKLREISSKKFLGNNNKSNVEETKELSLGFAETLVNCNKKETNKKLYKKSLSHTSKSNPVKYQSKCGAKKSMQECHFTYKDPKTVKSQLENKTFKEHILTESESDVSPAKKVCTLSLQKNNNLQKSVLSSKISRHFKRNLFSEYKLAVAESNFPFKAPKPVCQPAKKKYFTEHILTESESDFSSPKKGKRYFTEHILSESGSNFLSDKNMSSSGLKKLNNVQKPNSPMALPVNISVTLKRNYLSEHILTETESNFSCGALKPNNLDLKRTNFSEHILTKSESQITSVKQKISSSTCGDNCDRKSILPIISYEFFSDALKSMCESQNAYNCVIENSIVEKPRRFLKVKLCRSVKKSTNNKASRLTPRNALKHLDGESINKSIKIHSIDESKETVSTNLELKYQSSNQRSKLKSHNRNVNLQCKFNKNTFKLCDLNKRWKLFSPVLTKVTTYRASLKTKNASLRPKSGVNNIKPSLQIRHVKTSTVNQPNPVNTCVSPSTNQVQKKLQKYPYKPNMKLDQATVVDNKMEFQGKDKTKQMKYPTTRKTQNAVTQTDTIFGKENINLKVRNIQNSQENLCASHKRRFGNQIGFNDSSQVRSKERASIFGSKPSPNYTNHPSPFLTYFPEKQSNFTSNGLSESDGSRFFLELQNCSGVSELNIIKGPAKKVDFSPLLTVFNFHPLKPVTFKNTSFFSYLNYDENFKQKQISKDQHLNSITFSSVHKERKSHPQLNNYSYEYNNNLSSVEGSDKLYYQPLKGGVERETFPNKCIENHSNTPKYIKSTNILQDRNHENFLSSGVFKVTQNSTPEVLKLCDKSTFNKGSDHNFLQRRTKDETIKDTRSYKAENTEIITEFNSLPLFHHLNDTHNFSNILNVENKLDFAEKNTQTFQETNFKQLSNKNERIIGLNKINSATTVEYNDNRTKNASSANYENTLVFENTGTVNKDKNLPLEVNKPENPCSEDKGSIEQTIKKIEEADESSFTNWNKEKTLSGNVFYINRLTGMSSFTTPKEDCLEQTFVLENRHWFMPKGVSPILNIHRDSKSISKQLSATEKGVVEDILNANISELMNVKWRDGSVNQSRGTETVLNILNGQDNSGIWPAPLIDFQKSCVFSSVSLCNAQVLGQVDSKFIAAILKPNEEVNTFLVLFDQHAVDERIRLESLISVYKNPDGKLERHAINYSLEINLTKSETTLISELTDKISNLGLTIAVQGNNVIVTDVPLCLFNRYTREGENQEWLKNMVTTLLKQLLQSAQDDPAVTTSMPSLLADIINTEACRGSIKFGDFLTLDLCMILISKLATCEIPFQCAHGRPVLTPLIELKEVESVPEAINLKRLSERIQSNHLTDSSWQY